MKFETIPFNIILHVFTLKIGFLSIFGILLFTDTIRAVFYIKIAIIHLILFMTFLLLFIFNFLFIVFFLVLIAFFIQSKFRFLIFLLDTILFSIFLYIL